MKRRLSVIAACVVGGAAIALGGVPSQAATNSIEMNLDQTILVWSAVNEDFTPGAYNYDVLMSSMSTLTGEIAPVGYTFQPALKLNEPCPAPYEWATGCGGPIQSAAFDPSTRETYALMSGVDSPASMLYRIDTGTGASSFSTVLTLPDGSQPFGINGLFFNQGGELLAWKVGSGPSGSTTIYTINTATGLVTPTFELANSDFSGTRLQSLQYDNDGVLWAISTTFDNASSGTSYADTVDLDLQDVAPGVTIPNVAITDTAFDANGYLWALAANSELYAMDLADVSAIEDHGAAPGYSGAFVISDVPFPKVSGVADGDKVPQQQTVNVDISKARSGSPWSVEIHSTPVELATGEVAFGGNASVPLKIPASIPLGAHELVFTYVAPNGRTMTETIPITVAEPLPNTGAPSTEWLGFGIAGALTAGLALVLVYRIRRHRA